MNGLVLNFVPAAYISARIPYSWQSALSYPIPPPSAFLGMAAGAVMRAERISEEEALTSINSGRLSVHARLISPCRVKSHLLILVTKFRVPKGRRPTDALGRQFVFAQEYETVFLSPEEKILQRLFTAFRFAPVYFGDSESLVTVVRQNRIKFKCESDQTIVKTPYYTPLRAFNNISTQGTVYYVHETLQKKVMNKLEKKSRQSQYPLFEYIFPVNGNPSGYQPSELEGEINPDFEVYTWEENAIIRKREK